MLVSRIVLMEEMEVGVNGAEAIGILLKAGKGSVAGADGAVLIHR